MRGSKIITTFMLILLFTVAMSLRNAEAQTPLACDAIPFTNGWISMTVSNNTVVPNLGGDTVEDLSVIYNAGLLGTVENSNGSVRAGLDWLYDDRQPNLETNMVGTQLVSWWTRKDGRNTILQATNTNPETAVGNIDLQSGGDSVASVLGAVTVHVQILGEDCIELRNFCDTYTPLDTVVYDFSNMVSNAGQTINIGNLAEREGIVVITPVETCAIAAPPTFNAVSWNYMQGSVRIIDESGDYEYGTNVRARTAAPGEAYQSSLQTCVGTSCAREFVYNFYEEVDNSNCEGGFPAANCAAQALFKDFNSIGTNPGSDLVLISFGDYGLCGTDPSDSSDCNLTNNNVSSGNFGTPGVYSAGPLASATQFGPFAIFDDAENPESCPAVFGCFLRIGVDEGIPSTDDVIPVPPPAECLIDPETGFPVDCSDPLCKPLDGCENPNFPPDGSLCTDGIDNDEVDGIDCADFGCDGFIVDSETGVQCESSGEISCEDEFDNDNNGFTDCGLLGGEADPNCVAIGACGSSDDGDGGDGGCTVAAGPVSGTSSAANFLLPLLPLAGVFAVRRMIRRRRK